MSIDSTVIDLSPSMFDWANYQRTKGAVKLHLVLDHDGYLPCFGVVIYKDRWQIESHLHV